MSYEYGCLGTCDSLNYSWFNYSTEDYFLSEEKKAEIEKIQEMSLSYRIYLLSRRDFVSAVLIGVASSLTISYLTQLDLILSNHNITIFSVLVRVIISSGFLGYLLYSHRKRTKVYETLLKKMSERTQRLSEELKP